MLGPSRSTSPPLLPGGVSEAGGGLALAQVATIMAPLIDSVRRRQAMACRLTIDPHPCFRGRRGSVRQIERPLSRGTGQQVAGQAIVPVEDAPVAIDQFEIADLGAAAAAVLRHETQPLPGILQMPAQLGGSAGMRRNEYRNGEAHQKVEFWPDTGRTALPAWRRLLRTDASRHFIHQDTEAALAGHRVLSGAAALQDAYHLLPARRYAQEGRADHQFRGGLENVLAVLLAPVEHPHLGLQGSSAGITQRQPLGRLAGGKLQQGGGHAQAAGGRRQGTHAKQYRQQRPPQAMEQTPPGHESAHHPQSLTSTVTVSE